MENAISLITKNTEEIVTLDELKKKIQNGDKLTGYLGFEPSGLFHIGWLIWAQKVKDLMNAGVKMKLLVATWHAWINDKLGGDMELIEKAGKYTIDILSAYGIDTSKLDIVDANDLIKDKNYWELVLRVAKNTTLARMKRALTIMGRKTDEAELDTSKLFYPAMQVSDIFYLDVDIALGGTDQRKAHMLAREVAERLNKKKVIAIHTPLLVGLKGGQRMESLEEDELLADVKMSKSKPENAIFVNDSQEEIESKIRAAYCPKGIVDLNPILQIDKYIIFANTDTFKIERDIKYGGDIEFKNYEELEKAYVEGKIHPMDLKTATARKLNEILDPIRKKINTPEYQELTSIIIKNVTR
ncbi:tyrosine--tRNA ligase [Acidianus manzaensis]|uniref:Tyrosine--tRNA ligase n=1 Tax=Acidianus manzaensis TaxID=282676 RepID=A0A1W6JZZ3_9CREN|nr:tyrosine--tRNA ligase [Acidianus manzaensis]ARM75764.1 tyrosine--tRNA ligase [Acidianus manzaensis]